MGVRNGTWSSHAIMEIDGKKHREGVAAEKKQREGVWVIGEDEYGGMLCWGVVWCGVVRYDQRRNRDGSRAGNFS